MSSSDVPHESGEDFFDQLCEAFNAMADLFEKQGPGKLWSVLRDLVQEGRFPIIFNDVTYQILFEPFGDLARDILALRKHGLSADAMQLTVQEKVRAFLNKYRDVFLAYQAVQIIDAGALLKVMAAVTAGSITASGHESDKGTPLQHITALSLVAAMKAKLQGSPSGTPREGTVEQRLADIKGYRIDEARRRLAALLGITDIDVLNAGPGKVRQQLIEHGKLPFSGIAEASQRQIDSGDSDE